MALTIIMYHYVRDLVRSRYPGIKGRSLTTFRGQLDYLARNYKVVKAEHVIAACKEGAELPENAAWLTFDDGYSDHYSSVFPLLYERGWQGSFFPPVATVRDGVLLDVNRVHFILAASSDTNSVIRKIRAYIDEHQEHPEVRPFSAYWSELAHSSRMDTEETIFIKRVLQHGLPEVLRNELAKMLFERFVSVDAATFAAELYMRPEQLRTMIGCGMYVGSHGAGHYWMDRLSVAEQVCEVDSSLEFLKFLGAPTEDWVMCYPFGAYNQSLSCYLEKRLCAVGLTTRVAIARVGIDDSLALPRVDTNDVPVL